MSIICNEGYPVEGLDKIPVSVLKPGELSASAVENRTAGRVRMPSGVVISVGGQAFKRALANGGVLIADGE